MVMPIAGQGLKFASAQQVVFLSRTPGKLLDPQMMRASFIAHCWKEDKASVGKVCLLYPVEQPKLMAENTSLPGVLLRGADVDEYEGIYKVIANNSENRDFQDESTYNAVGHVALNAMYEFFAAKARGNPATSLPKQFWAEEDETVKGRYRFQAIG